jgi:deazaflavin-dependent oxidoreductase (nitroreductase family)
MEAGGSLMTETLTTRHRVPRFVGLFNPIVRRLLRAGVPMGPNALLIVRGRKTGLERRVPIAILELDGRRWLQGTFGDVDWVRNLRAAGGGTIVTGKLQQPVRAVELDGDEAVAFFRDVVGPFVRRQRVGRRLIAALGAGDLEGDPVIAARNHPVFELLPSFPL